MQQIWRQLSATLVDAGRLFNRLTGVDLKSVDSQAFLLAMAENDPDALHGLHLSLARARLPTLDPALIAVNNALTMAQHTGNRRKEQSKKCATRR